MKNREKIILAFFGIALSILIVIIAKIIIGDLAEYKIKYTFVKILETVPESSMYQIEIQDQDGKKSWPYMAHYIANMFSKDSLVGREIVLTDITRAFTAKKENRLIDNRDSHFFIAIFKQ